MKKFFEAHQVKQLSHNKKIRYVLEQLTTALNPMTLPYSYQQTCVLNSKGDVKSKKVFMSMFISMTDDGVVNVINKLDVPFEDITVKADRVCVEITGRWFSYVFPAEMLLEMYARFKKVL